MHLQRSVIVFIAVFHIVLCNYGIGQIASPIKRNPYWPLDKQFYDNIGQLEQKFSQWNHLPHNLQQVRQQNQLQWRQAQVLWRQKYSGWMDKLTVWQQDLQQIQQAVGEATGFRQLVSSKLEASIQKNAQKWAFKKQSRKFQQSQLDHLHQLYLSQPHTGFISNQFYEFTKNVADLASDRFEDSAEYFADKLKVFAKGVKDAAGYIDDAFKYTGPLQLLQNQQHWQQTYALWNQKYAGWLQDVHGSWQKDLQELHQSLSAAKGFGYLPSISKVNKHAAKQFSTKLKDVADYFKGELEIFGDGIKKVVDDIGDAIELRFKDKFKFVLGQYHNQQQTVHRLGGAGFLQPPQLPLQQSLPQQPLGLPQHQPLQPLGLPQHKPLLQAIFNQPQTVQQPLPIQPLLSQQQQQLPSFYRCSSLECEQKAFNKIPKFYKCTDIECERKAFQALQNMFRI